MAEEVEIPADHPRHDSLVTRHRIEDGVDAGITSKQGLIAEGRGEAFDYLLGEQTIPSADEAARVAAAHLLLADKPVLSVNGNVAALVPGEIVELAETANAALEVNLFNRSEERMTTVAEHLRAHGATEILGLDPDARIPGLNHERALVDADGIYDADVVLVPLEDGDRAAALKSMGKLEIVIDLNPMSRSAQVAAVPIVDNIIRAVPNIERHVQDLRGESRGVLEAIVEEFDADRALNAAERQIRRGSAGPD